ncbi:hypothetical protein BD311DRAFT_797246 [Dichomitus squalens]|uniref:DUF6535 domain-containing protein n=1 Tax=Dichomitus squalens TaxID=114155 RepID=A0A4Q9MLB9_9APHY|nr:hypothetical protein BD311DRAFT_797246 [Dichomitus squalens]
MIPHIQTKQWHKTFPRILYPSLPPAQPGERGKVSKTPSEGATNVNAEDPVPLSPESPDEGNPKASKSKKKLLDEWIQALKNKHSREERIMVLDESGDIMHDHSITMVKRWTKKMDILLTFVGLFSAVLTVFVVLSYQLLQPGPADPSAIVIQTPAQPVGFSCNVPFANSLHQPYRFTTPMSQFAAPMLMRWRVPAIVTAVPSLLQVALVLFLSGLIIIHWSAHPIVATVVSVIAALVLAFILGALLTSPAISFLIGQVKWLSRRLAYQATISIQHVIQARCLASFVSLQHLERLDNNLVSIMTTIQESDQLARRGGESVAVVEQKAPLIHDTMRWAYTFSKDNKPLNHAAVCLGRFGDPALVQYYDNILRTITDRWTDIRKKSVCYIGLSRRHSWDIRVAYLGDTVQVCYSTTCRHYCQQDPSFPNYPTITTTCHTNYDCGRMEAGDSLDTYQWEGMEGGRGKGGDERGYETPTEDGHVRMREIKHRRGPSGTSELRHRQGIWAQTEGFIATD